MIGRGGVGMAMGATGDMYINSAPGGLVRVISGGYIRTLAGCVTGNEANWCSGQDNVQQGNFMGGNAVTVDRDGYVYFANSPWESAIYKLDPASGAYSIVAGERGGASWYCGNATTDYFGDGCPAIGGRVYALILALDSSNNLYWAEAFGDGTTGPGLG